MDLGAKVRWGLDPSRGVRGGICTGAKARFPDFSGELSAAQAVTDPHPLAG